MNGFKDAGEHDAADLHNTVLRAFELALTDRELPAFQKRTQR